MAGKRLGQLERRVAEPQRDVSLLHRLIVDGEARDAAEGLGEEHHQRPGDAIGRVDSGLVEQPPGYLSALRRVDGLAGELAVAGGEIEPRHEALGDCPAYEWPGQASVPWALREPGVDVRLAAAAELPSALRGPGQKRGGAIQLRVRAAQERVAEIGSLPLVAVAAQHDPAGEGTHELALAGIGDPHASGRRSSARGGPAPGRAPAARRLLPHRQAVDLLLLVVAEWQFGHRAIRLSKVCSWTCSYGSMCAISVVVARHVGMAQR